MTKADSEAKKDYSNKYNKRASDIVTGKSVPLPGGPVPFYYTIKALDKISRGITNLFSDDAKKPKLEKLKKPKVDKPKIKVPKLKD
jgi:hypothetical protein